VVSYQGFQPGEWLAWGAGPIEVIAIEGEGESVGLNKVEGVAGLLDEVYTGNVEAGVCDAFGCAALFAEEV
jgi:hypothetical protein